MAEFTVTISTPDDDMTIHILEQTLLDALHTQSVLSRDFGVSQLSITGVTPESYYEILKSNHRAEIHELEKDKLDLKRLLEKNLSTLAKPAQELTEVNDINLLTHIDDNDFKYRYIGDNVYEVWMDKADEPYWRQMTYNIVDFASRIRCVDDINTIAKQKAKLIYLIEKGLP